MREGAVRHRCRVGVSRPDTGKPRRHRPSWLLYLVCIPLVGIGAAFVAWSALRQLRTPVDETFFDPKSWVWFLYLRSGWDLLLRAIAIVTLAIVGFQPRRKKRRWGVRHPRRPALWLFAMALPLLLLYPIVQRMNHLMSVSASTFIDDGARAFRSTRGRYPADLVEFCRFMRAERKYSSVCQNKRRDAWGRPLLYFVRHDGYVVVSLGRDGKAQHKDFWRLRANKTWVHDCSLDADLVDSDRGRHVTCGK